MNENQLGWYEAYVKADDNNPKLARKLEAAAQALWDIYADKANQEVYNQFSDEDDDVLFTIKLYRGKAMRFYKEGFRKPLFRGDIYDILIVGMADELIYGGGYGL